MPTYRLTVTATASIEETWEVHADEPLTREQIEERFHEQQGTTFISDRTTGDEENREITTIEELTP